MVKKIPFIKTNLLLGLRIPKQEQHKKKKVLVAENAIGDVNLYFLQLEYNLFLPLNSNIMQKIDNWWP